MTEEQVERLRPVWVLRDFDSCACGDYRHQHQDGIGWCRMPNDLTHGFKPCTGFRQVKAAAAIPDSYTEVQS